MNRPTAWVAAAMLAAFLAAGSIGVNAASARTAGAPLVPGHPKAVVIQFDKGISNNPITRRPGLSTDPTTVAALAAQLNGLTPVPAGVHPHCPMDDGSKWVLRFLYRYGAPDRVIVKTSGCRWVSHSGKPKGAAHHSYWSSSAVVRAIHQAYHHRWATL